MSEVWRIHKRDVFIRDIVRDYCKVHIVLSEQAERFAHSGTISYAVLNELLGDVLRKGVLWRLKDAAHHLFRAHPAPVLVTTCKEQQIKAEPNAISNEQGEKHDTLADMLDWCVGYAFHECVKLKEDAFQRQHYTNRLLQLRNNNEYQDTIEGLMPFTQQTNESISREMQRILGVLNHIRDLLLLFLEGHKDNGHVARLLVEDKELVQKSFGESFDKFLCTLYGTPPTKHYILALQLTLNSGHKDKALNIINKAREGDAHAAVINDMEKLMANHTELVAQ